MSLPTAILALALAAAPAALSDELTTQNTERTEGVEERWASAPASLSAGAALLTLDEALKQAHEKSYDLRQAREKLVQAKEPFRKILAAYLPQLTLGASYTRNQVAASFILPTNYWIRSVGPNDRNGPPFDPNRPLVPGEPSGDIFFPDPSSLMSIDIQKKDMLGLQLKLQQALLVPALWPAFKLTEMGEELAKVSVESARREILFGVLQIYYGCVAAKEVIAVQEKILQNNQERENDARVRVELGALPQIGLLRAQIDRANAEQDLERAKLAYASAKLMLGTLIDREEDFEVEHPAEPQEPGAPQELMEQAEKDRVDLQAARLNRELAEKARKAVWYQYAPSILGVAQYQLANVKGFSDSYGAWALGLVLGWTLWDGGLRESELRESSSKMAEAELSLRGAQLKIRDEIRSAHLALKVARANRSKAEETVKLARSNYEMVTVNYQAGAATQIEISDANTQLAQAELGLIAESLNAQLAALKLLKAAGGFNPSF